MAPTPRLDDLSRLQTGDRSPYCSCEGVRTVSTSAWHERERGRRGRRRRRSGGMETREDTKGRGGGRMMYRALGKAAKAKRERWNGQDGREGGREGGGDEGGEGQGGDGRMKEGKGMEDSGRQIRRRRRRAGGGRRRKVQTEGQGAGGGEGEGEGRGRDGNVERKKSVEAGEARQWTMEKKRDKGRGRDETMEVALSKEMWRGYTDGRRRRNEAEIKKSRRKKKEYKGNAYGRRNSTHGVGLGVWK
ncbi:hypothetical protein FB451DRAFT_1168629 [Mycena latifolia]|nr:hypothetical protein FB451DRAFT_1168629 [Mycena latifolia]